MSHHEVKRRTFLRMSGGLAVAAATAGSVVACRNDEGGGGSPGGEGDPSSGITLPTYRKLEPVTPDLPGDADGVPDAFFTFGKDPTAVTSEVPGSGGTVTSMLGLAGSAPPPGVDKNAWWKGLNERIGVDLDITMVADDYNAKVSTVIAGGDIPDLVQMPKLPRLPEMLESQFEDLTEYLSGDAVLDYPCLASLPEYMWRTTTYRGGIRAVPPGNIVGQPTWTTRADVLEGVGADISVATDADQVLALFQELTDAKSNQYAIADPGGLRNLVATMYGAPNLWQEDGGHFSHQYESDEYRAGLEYAAKLWDAGVIHPDAFGGANGPELFRGGKVAFFAWGGVGYRSLLRAGIPDLKLGFWGPPKAEGGGVGAKRLGTGTYQLCAIRKQDSPDRVRELLRILNYFATPFGSQEYLYLKFGEEGTHWTWDEELSAPVGNQAISSERINVSYFASAPYELFDPGDQDVTEAMHAHQVETIGAGLRNAAASLYSSTDDQVGATLTANVDDVANNVIQGRASLSDWDTAVDEWRAGGGDTIRGELEQAHAEVNEG